MSKPNILLIGGDLRFYHAARILKEKEYQVDCFLVPKCSSSDASLRTLKEKILSSEILIAPIPFSKDNIHLNTSNEFQNIKIEITDFLSCLTSKNTIIGTGFDTDITSFLYANYIRYVDICQDKCFVYKNSILTAEGLIKYIIDTTPFSINGSKTLILGYGSCGSAIASLMRSLGSDVTIYNRNPYYDCIATTKGFKTLSRLTADNSLSDFEIIINTIPAILFDISHYNQLKKDPYFYEIASGDGGFSKDIYALAGERIKKLPGIPGKTAPQSAAYAICKIVEEVCNES